MGGIARGSSYFLKEIDKSMPDEDISALIKLSTTFFRMCFECAYVWGTYYFPGSSFEKIKNKVMKMSKWPKFPNDFKFYTQKKIDTFRQNCGEVIKKMNEHVLRKE